MKTTPLQSKLFLMAGVFFILLPSVLNLYKGETGRLIVASGKMNDPNFDQTAIYMFHHSYDSAYGLVINRPLPQNDLERVPAFLKGKDIPLYYGGPAGYPEVVVILERGKDKAGHDVLLSHAFDDIVKDDPAILDKIVASIHAGEKRYRVYLGYAGWGLFQIEREFGQGVWASTTLDPDWLGYEELSPREIWLRALHQANDKRKPRNPGAI